MRQLGFILLAWTLAPVGATLAQEPAGTFAPELAVELELVLDAELVKWGWPGVSAAVTIDGHGLWTGVAGLTEPRGSEPIEPEMLFGMASVTKTMTSAVLLLLAEEGRLSLDDSVGKWVQPLRHVDPEITIRELLNHTSGVNNHTNHGALWDSISADHSRFWQPEEVFKRFVGLPWWMHGQQYRYSNSNYLILGMIIEAAAGPVAQNFEERLWTPLGLEAIYLSTEEEPTGRLANGWTDLNGNGRLDDTHEWYAPAWQSISWTGGAMFSTASDLVQAGRAPLLGDLLSAESKRQMLTFVDNGANGYGLGVIRYRPFGIDFVGHSGNTIGYSSFLACSDEHGICATALVNENARPVHETVFALVERILAFLSTATSAASPEAPAGRSGLAPVYPNPVQSTAHVQFELSEPGVIRLVLFDVLGREVAILSEGSKSAGTHRVALDASRFPAGLYSMVLDAQGERSAQTLVLSR